MRKYAPAAIFFTITGYAIAATAILDGIQGTIAEKAIEIFGICAFMAGEILTLPVAEKFKAIF